MTGRYPRLMHVHWSDGLTRAPSSVPASTSLDSDDETRAADQVLARKRLREKEDILHDAWDNALLLQEAEQRRDEEAAPTPMAKRKATKPKKSKNTMPARSSTRIATSASLVTAPAQPRFDRGERVRRTFHDGYFCLGDVTQVSTIADGLFCYSVVYDDDDYEEDIHENELRMAREAREAVGDPPMSHQPSPEQLEAARAKCRAEKGLPPIDGAPSSNLDWRLPAPTIPDAVAPGGASHCGGDLIFPNLTVADETLGFDMPKFIMGSGAGVCFSGAASCHGTGPHHDEELRRPGCEAHVSFAIQTPALTLGVERRSAARHELHEKFMGLGAQDARSEAWADAVWVPVWRFAKRPPTGYLQETEELRMAVLRWTKIVLYDVDTDEPLVLYDLYGGLLDGPPIGACEPCEPEAGGGADESARTQPQSPSEAAPLEAEPFEAAPFARSHFGFLHSEWRFGLNRSQILIEPNERPHEPSMSLNALLMRLDCDPRLAGTRAAPTAPVASTSTRWATSGWRCACAYAVHTCTLCSSMLCSCILALCRRGHVTCVHKAGCTHAHVHVMCMAPTFRMHVWTDARRALAAAQHHGAAGASAWRFARGGASQRRLGRLRRALRLAGTLRWREAQAALERAEPSHARDAAGGVGGDGAGVAQGAGDTPGPQTCAWALELCG